MEDKKTLPKLVIKRELSYPLRRILTLLRKKHKKFDTSGEKE